MLYIPRRATVAALWLCALLGGSAWAGDPMTDAMQEAYAPYRAALFRTNGTSQSESRQALDQARQAWSSLIAKFGASPPAPYDRDASFGAALAAVAKVYAKASDEVAANQLSKAHETLEQARDIMADLRRRNQVVTFSDHMNEYHAVMEQVLDQSGKTLAQSDGIARLTASAGVLQYLAGRLASEAPPGHAQSSDFSPLVKAIGQSVGDLQAALLAQDATAVKTALGKLKPAYSKLFLRFG